MRSQAQGKEQGENVAPSCFAQTHLSFVTLTGQSSWLVVARRMRVHEPNPPGTMFRGPGLHQLPQ